MNEEQAADRFIYEALSGLVSGRVYPSLAPQGAARPFIVWSHQGGSAMHAAGSDWRFLTLPLFLAKAVADGNSYAAADAIAADIDAALTGLSDSVTIDGTVYTVQGCRREVAVRYTEEVAGKPIRHVGGIYRLWISHS